MENLLTAQLTLDDAERNLCQLLLRASGNLNMGTVVRIAGGWVRDKLLCLSGEKDIDVALSNVSGEAFVAEVVRCLQSDGLESSHFGVIQANPEKSKHLATASTSIFGFSLDFVNLRSEDYTETSRVPIIKFGSPEQDAYRRDFTINSMFYNVNEDRIEDLTNRGMEDLANCLISTPLAPLTTFLDDPLRLLRAVRFSSRLNYRLSSDILSCCQLNHSDLISSFKTKLTLDRIGGEIVKLFGIQQPCPFNSLVISCNRNQLLVKSITRPYLAVGLLLKMNLFDSIFHSNETDANLPSMSSLHQHLNCKSFGLATLHFSRLFLCRLLRVGYDTCDNDVVNVGKNNLAIFIISCLLSGYRSMWTQDLEKKKSVSFDLMTNVLANKILCRFKKTSAAVASLIELASSTLIPLAARFDGDLVGNDPSSDVMRRLRSEVVLIFIHPPPVATDDDRSSEGRHAYSNPLSLWSLFVGGNDESTAVHHDDDDDDTVTTDACPSSRLSYWALCIVLACSMHLSQHCSHAYSDIALCVCGSNTSIILNYHGSSSVICDNCLSSSSDRMDWFETACRPYLEMIHWIESSGCGRILESKIKSSQYPLEPLFTGKELMKELRIPAGPLIGSMLKRQFVWQLENPDKSRQDFISEAATFIN